MTDARRSDRLDDQAGLTLIELMVVLVMIAIGVLALSGVQTGASKDVFSTGRRTRALALAQQQMEVTRNLGFTLAADTSGTADGMNWTTAIDSADIGLNRVAVTVTWADPLPDSVRLVNLLAQR